MTVATVILQKQLHLQLIPFTTQRNLGFMNMTLYVWAMMELPQLSVQSCIP